MDRRTTWTKPVILAAVLAASAAGAQPSGEGPSGADAHLEAGRKLLKEGKTKEACAEFEASKRAQGSMEGRLELARCYEALGRTASAYTEYFDILTLAPPDPGPSDVTGEPSRRVEALRDKLCKLKIV